MKGKILNKDLSIDLIKVLNHFPPSKKKSKLWNAIGNEVLKAIPRLFKIRNQPGKFELSVSETKVIKVIVDKYIRKLKL